MVDFKALREKNERIRRTRIVVPDFESLSACDLKRAGAYRYWQDPTTEIICLSYSVDDGPIKTWFPGQDASELAELASDPDTYWVPHNAQFEKQGWRNQMTLLYGLPDIPNNRWHCSQARAANLVLPQQLEKLCRIPLLGLEGEKDMVGSKLVIGWSRKYLKTGERPTITADDLKRAGEYCERDVEEQRRVHNRLGFLAPDERRVYLLDQRINERGVRLDMPLVHQMQRIVDDASVPLAAEFKELTGGLKMTQRDKFLGWMMDRGVLLPNLTKETVAAVLGETDEGEEVDYDDRIFLDLPRNVERALEIRQLIGSASVKKLASMRDCVCGDGRARGLLAYHGAGPGRWAGRLLQPQNFPRGTTREDWGVDAKGERILKAPDIDALVETLMTGDYEWVQSIYGPAVETVLSSLRHTIIAEDDRELVAGDYAGIEARLTLAFAGQWDKVALMASGADVYCDMATDIYGRVITKADVEERQIGKNSVLGLGFGMGPPKFHGKYCAAQPFEFAQRVVTTYRKVWAPNVPKLWYELGEAATRTVWDRKPHEARGVRYSLRDVFLVATYPDGSETYYFNPQRTREAMPWDPDDIREGWTYQAMKQGRLTTIKAFGGLLAENYAQHMARQLLAGSIGRCEKERFPVVLTVHDEIVAEPVKGLTGLTKPADVLQQIMEDVEPWAKQYQVPVKSETWAGPRYRK